MQYVTFLKVFTSKATGHSKPEVPLPDCQAIKRVLERDLKKANSKQIPYKLKLGSGNEKRKERKNLGGVQDGGTKLANCVCFCGLGNVGIPKED